MHIGKFQIVLNNFFKSKKLKTEEQYSSEIDDIIAKDYANIDQHNFRDFGWGYVLSSKYFATDKGINYGGIFYIVTEEKHLIRNGKDVSDKVSPNFILERYDLFKNNFCRETKKLKVR